MSEVSNRTPPLNDGDRDISADSGIVSSNRRRLLTGAAALPVIMTLPTNASATAFGSAMQCMENQPQPVNGFEMVPPGHWATQPLTYFKVEHGNDRQTIGDFGNYIFYDIDSRPWTYQYWNDKYISPDGTGYRKVSGSDARGGKFIWIAQDGSVMGTDLKYRSMGGIAPSCSCYVSIMNLT